jgi:hypothetical protein
VNLNLFFPPETILWLTRYGLFAVLVFFSALLLALVLRPFWMWYSGKSEVLERLKRLEEDSRKSLLELEILNQTLSIPVKRAAQKAKAAERAEEPMVVSQETKEGFLKALASSRTRIAEASDDEE